MWSKGVSLGIRNKTIEDMATKNLTTRRNDIISKIRNLSEFERRKKFMGTQDYQKMTELIIFDAVDKYFKVSRKGQSCTRCYQEND